MFLEEIFSTPIYGFDLELDVDSIRYWCYSVLKENPGRQISNIGGWQSEDFREFGNTPLTDLILYAVKESHNICLLYTSPSPRDNRVSRMPSSA